MTSFHILFPLSEEYGSYHFPTTHHISRRYSDSRPSALTLLDVVTDYEHQERAFSKIPNFWAWADKLSRKFWGHLGYFRPKYSTYLGTVSPLSMVVVYLVQKTLVFRPKTLSEIPNMILAVKNLGNSYHTSVVGGCSSGNMSWKKMCTTCPRQIDSHRRHPRSTTTLCNT